MSIHEQTADVLDGAADYIEQHGWGKPPFHGNTTCIGLAIYLVSDGEHQASRARRAVLQLLGFPRRSALRYLAIWNDEPGRTEQEVLDALRATAKAKRCKADLP